MCATDLMNWADWASFILLMVLGTWKLIEIEKRLGGLLIRYIDRFVERRVKR